MTSSNICPYCNISNRPNASYCTNCGTALVVGSVPRRAMHGRYTIMRSLGKGGMGALYLASETIANRERLVVVKEMLDYFNPDDPQDKQKAHKRFELEAATLASLNVAGVPQIFDFFSEGGRNYIVMQFIEGKNLETGLTHLDENDDTVRGKPYPVDQVRRWGIRLCKILEILATQGVIHMDIKPSNLILDKSGDIWLVDFGTAKDRHFGPPGSRVGLQKSSVYGTVGYAPPEQVAGKPEARSDVFALAATLYHLMTDDDPRNDPYAFPKMGQLPGDVARALKGAIKQNVQKRIKAAEFGRLLDVRPATTSPAFRWQDGTTALEPSDLVATADRNWDEALEYYNGDAWSKWLKDLHRHDILAQLRTTKTQNKNADLALDNFLRLVDPSLPPPQMQIPVPEMDAGVMPWQTQRTLDLEIRNTGSGCLQGRFTNVFACLQVDPVEFIAHKSQMVKVTLDSGALTPSSQPQQLYLTIDAGSAGQERLPVKVTVPEPRLMISTPTLRLGTAYRGRVMSGTFRVSNQGGSAFMGEIKSDVDWVKVTPVRFLCLPGKSYDVTVEVDTVSMRSGEHSTPLTIRAQAGKWEQIQTMNAVVRVSTLRTFLKFWLPPLASIGAWTVYGAFLGSVLGLFGGLFDVQILDPSAGLLTGALFGALIFVFPGTVFGALGRLGGWSGSDGARVGAALGGGIGVVAGSLVGAFLQEFLPRLGLDLGSGSGFGIFGLLIGTLIGVTLGIALWLMPRR